MKCIEKIGEMKVRRQRKIDEKAKEKGLFSSLWSREEMRQMPYLEKGSELRP